MYSSKFCPRSLCFVIECTLGSAACAPTLVCAESDVKQVYQLCLLQGLTPFYAFQAFSIALWFYEP